MRATALWLIGLLLALAVPASAQDTAEAGEEEWDDGGVYTSFGVSLAFQTLDTGLGNSEPGVGFQWVLGYRPIPFLAAEFEIERTSIDIRTLAVTTYTVEPTLYTANVKGILPLSRLDMLEPYALVGLGVAFTKTTDRGTGTFVEWTDFAARFGAGFDLRMHERVTVGFSAEYVMPTGSQSDYDYVSIQLFKLGVVLF